MKIFIASDHAGFELKKKIINHLNANNYEVEDCGAYELDSNDDYPDFVIPCAVKVAGNSMSLGVVIGGSGQGEAICANKIKGIRAAYYYGGDLEVVRLSREHNFANMISFGARFLTDERTIEALDLWLNTNISSEERHVRRVEKIKNLEK